MSTGKLLTVELLADVLDRIADKSRCNCVVSCDCPTAVMPRTLKEVATELRNSLKTCVAWEPLRHGSRKCQTQIDTRRSLSDLCEEHRELIQPHQLVDGAFYVYGGEES